MDLPGLKKLLKIAVVGAFEAVKPHIEQLKREEADAPSVAPVTCTCGHLLGVHLITGGCTGKGTTGEYNDTPHHCSCEQFTPATDA